MIRFTVLAAILAVVGRLIAINAPNSLFGILEGIGQVGLVIAALYYVYRVLSWFMQRVLWKVRNKLIVSFAFVGIIPVVILILFTWLSITFIFRQLSVVFLEDEFDYYVATLHDATERVVSRYYRSPDASLPRLRQILQQEQEAAAELYPGWPTTNFRLLRHVLDRNGARYTQVAGYPRGTESELGLEIPHWSGNGFSGLVRDGERTYFNSTVPVAVDGNEYLICAEMALADPLIQLIQRRTSIELRLLPSQLSNRAAFESDISDFFQSHSKMANVRWAHIVKAVNWRNQVNAEDVDLQALIEVPLSALFQNYFTQTTGFGGTIVAILGLLLISFVLVEVVSLIIGIGIARSITRSIHNIYAGARNIQAGNFDYRIPSADRDQLESMATAFNKMSESVVGLMSQVTEKQRLDKEIEIAREVQTHLFPREMPTIKRIELAGSCLPARHVSGDYYDFIPYGDSLLDVIIADISGKGISAALLMANLQSSIRSHAVYQNAYENGNKPIASAMEAINRQLYKHTSPDKFATLVLARVNSAAMTATYCNAGHNPPLLISQGEVSKLGVGGIVAGLFEDPEYHEETVALRSGDLLVFYTDGVVEAEDPAGNQFEEERLEKLVRENSFLTAEDIRGLILQDVLNWAAGQEQHDDVTVVTMKVSD